MISQQARDMLAARYRADAMPWFAEDILAGKSKQFDRPLKVITAALEGKPDEAETPQPQDELAPEGGLDWPPVLMLALLLVVTLGTAYVVVYGRHP